MSVANRVKFARESLGWSQEELAIKSGLKSKTSISRIENSSDDKITSKTVKKLADAMGIPAAQLMGWTAPKFDESHIELISLYSRLTKEQQNTILALMRSMLP